MASKKKAPKKALKKVVKKKAPKKAPKKAVKKKAPKKSRIHYLETGSMGYPESTKKEVAEHFSTSSHMQRQELDRPTIEGISAVARSFEKGFLYSADKVALEPSQISVYRHGIILRPRHGAVSKDFIEQVSKEFPGEIHVTDEKDTFSVRLNFGSSSASTDYMAASEKLDEYGEILERIRRMLEDEYGDVDWFTFWDTEEAMYE